MVFFNRQAVKTDPGYIVLKSFIPDPEDPEGTDEFYGFTFGKTGSLATS